MDDLLADAQKTSDQLGQKVQSKLDNLFEAAEADKVKEAAQRANPKIGYDNAKGSLLDGHDDFFSKASKFADGDYHGDGKKTNIADGDMSIGKDPDFVKKAKEGTVFGFEDLDGDGDELIDDAIILDDE